MTKEQSELFFLFSVSPKQKINLERDLASFSLSALFIDLHGCEIGQIRENCSTYTVFQMADSDNESNDGQSAALLVVVHSASSLGFTPDFHDDLAVFRSTLNQGQFLYEKSFNVIFDRLY